MSTTSRLAAAEDALYTVLVGLAGTANVPISRAHPQDQLQREHMWIDAAVEATQVWETTGDGAQNKSEFMPFDVFVQATEHNYLTARDRALTLAGVIEDELRSNPRVGAPGAVWDSEVTSLEKDASPGEDGWVCVIRLRWEARAFLS